MLVLGRKEQDSIVIDDQIVIRVNRVHGNRVILGLEAPRDVSICRSELQPSPHDSASRYESSAA